jgi:hypothetical protein
MDRRARVHRAKAFMRSIEALDNDARVYLRSRIEVFRS